MPTEHAIDDPDAVTDALSCPHLTPPPPPADIGSGAVAELRASMARFRGGDDHAAPRVDVERAMARIDLDALADLAADHARPLTAIEEAAERVPVRALAQALGCELGVLDEVAVQVEAVAAVIGRGVPATAEADLAAAGLLDRFVDHPDGPVAAVSLLYQVRDATAALIRTIHAHANAHAHAVEGGVVGGGLDLGRPSAIPGTVRVATGAVEVAGHAVEEGDVVRLAFTVADQEFGAGPHACPGADAARAITAAVLAELDAVTD